MTLTQAPKTKGYFAVLLLSGLLASALGAALGAYLGMAIFRLTHSFGFASAPYFYQFFPFIGAFLGWLLGSIGVIWVSVRRLGRFMGGHMAVVFLMFFIPIISANLLLATNAVRTFPGLEVKNSYVASQQFNERKAAQEKLNWTVYAEQGEGLLHLKITDQTGNPVEVADLKAVVGRATNVVDDVSPEWRFDGTSYVAPLILGKGNWNIRMVAHAMDGTEFAQRVVLHIKD